MNTSGVDAVCSMLSTVVRESQAVTSTRDYGVRMDREFEPNPDDEREVDLSDEPEISPPPTLDPDERVEEEEDEDPPPSGETWVPA